MKRPGGFTRGRLATEGDFYVKQGLRTTLVEPAEELRTLELERLDAMWAAIWPQVKNGRLIAVDRALRIMEGRAQLLDWTPHGARPST